VLPLEEEICFQDQCIFETGSGHSQRYRANGFSGLDYMPILVGVGNHWEDHLLRKKGVTGSGIPYGVHLYSSALR